MLTNTFGTFSLVTVGLVSLATAHTTYQLSQQSAQALFDSGANDFRVIAMFDEADQVNHEAFKKEIEEQYLESQKKSYFKIKKKLDQLKHQLEHFEDDYEDFARKAAKVG